MSREERDIGRTFLRGLATLCGSSKHGISRDHLRVIAEQHDATLFAECGIDTSQVLKRELNVFGSIQAASTNKTTGGAPEPTTTKSGVEPTYESLGTRWGPLTPGTLDELLPPSPALLHFPTRRGLPIINPRDGDTLLPMNEVGMLVAPGSSGKTMFFLQLLVAIATGTPFLGKFAVGEAAAMRPVVMICAEDRREQIMRRLQLIFRQVLPHSSPQDRREAEGRIHIVSVAGVGSERLILKTFEGSPMASLGFKEFSRAAATIQPAVVVLDPLSRLLSGNVDLSSEVGTEWVATLESMLQASEAPMAAWFAHHSNKASRHAQIRSEDDEPIARGTSGLFDAVRVEAYLSSVPGSQVVFRVRKNNHGPRMEFKEREILIRGEHGILRAITTEEQATLVAAKANEKAALQDEADQETLRRIIVALVLNPGTTSKETLRGIVARGKSSFDRAFSILLAGTVTRSSMVTQLKKGQPFTLHAHAIASEFPEIVDNEKQLVAVGRWCTEEWPRGIRDRDASIRIESGPVGSPSVADKEEAARSATTGSPESKHPPLKGDVQSGLMGRLRTPPITPPVILSSQASQIVSRFGVWSQSGPISQRGAA